MPNADLTEPIIEAIKQYPMLYNPDHAEFRNLRKKMIAWDQLGAQFGEAGEIMKRKWKNIRDSYAKYLRSLEMDPTSYSAGAKYAKFWNKWRFASHMDPFKPFLVKDRSPGDREQSYVLNETSGVEPELISTDVAEAAAANLNSSGFVHVYDELKDGIVEDYTTFHHKKRKYDPMPTSMPKKTPQKEYDALEHLFLYHAKTMKTFSPRRQIQTKMRIAQIMMEQEVEEQNERQRLGTDRPNDGSPIIKQQSM